MAVTITDTRTIVNEADSLTGWTGNADGLFSSAPTPVESANCIGTQVSNETQNVYFTGTSRNLTNNLFYIWGLPGGVLATTVNGGVRVVLGDGTNTVAYEIAGEDTAGFRHGTGPVTWQCFVIDTGNLPTVIQTISGNAGSINFGAITEFGIGFTTLAKSVGGQENCFIDISRFGRDGLTITGGTLTTDEGQFSEIATADRGIGNQQGYGICRQLAGGVFGLQGPLTIGDGTGTANTFFSDTNTTVVFENRNLGTDKYFINLTGNGTGTTNINFGESTGAGLGSDGVVFNAPVGVSAAFSASSANISQLGFYGSTISGFDNGVNFSTNSSVSSSYKIYGSTFSGCGQIDVGYVDFQNNSIDGSVGTAATRIINTDNFSDISYTSAGTGHAILIDTPGSYTFTNVTFDGYASTDGSTGNEVL